MKYIRNLISSVLILFLVLISSAYALVVDFEEYDPNHPNYNGVTTIKSTFVGPNPVTNPSSNAANPANSTQASPVTNSGGPYTLGAPGSTGIVFSGGVLLDDPSNGVAGQVVSADGGSIYYGTASSPSSGTLTSNIVSLTGEHLYTNTITIDIDPLENVTSIHGEFINGLNTSALVSSPTQTDLFADYLVSYFTGDDGDVMLGGTSLDDVGFDNGASLLSFGLDTLLLSSEVITKVTITALDFSFGGGESEWDFLLASVSFNEGASPVPLPAALPLFMSALLGGFVAARRKKSSDHKVSSYISD